MTIPKISLQRSNIPQRIIRFCVSRQQDGIYDRDRVRDLTAQGKNRAVVAATLGVGVNRLREDYALELDAGREQAKAARAEEADAAALSQSQYHFLRVAELSFTEGSWIDSDGRNLLFRGVDGEGAKDLADAYAFWASNGERFNTTGLSTRFDPAKAARFAEIVNDYRNKFETGKTNVHKY
jgi:hypothetical protein